MSLIVRYLNLDENDEPTEPAQIELRANTSLANLQSMVRELADELER
jgi:hypothetical protein